MDFLMLFFIYSSIFSSMTFLFYFGNSPTLKHGPIGKVRNFVCDILQEAVDRVIPQTMVDLVSSLIAYIFYQKNIVMQAMFGILVLMGHIIYVMDVLPLLYMFNPDQNNVLFAMFLAFTNLYFFNKTCVSDPGEITSSNHSKYLKLYPADGSYYQNRTICRTCHFVKPARSKHCSLCDKCVYRFDHHCIWANNCVGMWNLRYFILYLFSLEMMFLNGAFAGVWSLNLFVANSHLSEASYVASDGSVRPITVFVLLQHLFMTFPRVVFLVFSLSVCFLWVGGFFVYHMFLILTNQTTNERYKLGSLMPPETNDEGASGDIQTTSGGSQIYRPYDSGMLQNLREVFFPRCLLRTKTD
ncbi:hypothetical protein ScPMuIL_003572 [Solemya velum]